jgi:hypothetical protein
VAFTTDGSGRRLVMSGTPGHRAGRCKTGSTDRGETPFMSIDLSRCRSAPAGGNGHPTEACRRRRVARYGEAARLGGCVLRSAGPFRCRWPAAAVAPTTGGLPAVRWGNRPTRAGHCGRRRGNRFPTVRRETAGQSGWRCGSRSAPADPLQRRRSPGHWGYARIGGVPTAAVWPQSGSAAVHRMSTGVGAATEGGKPAGGGSAEGAVRCFRGGRARRRQFNMGGHPAIGSSAAGDLATRLRRRATHCHGHIHSPVDCPLPVGAPDATRLTTVVGIPTSGVQQAHPPAVGGCSAMTGLLRAKARPPQRSTRSFSSHAAWS